jgi:hypothetical protein
MTSPLWENDISFRAELDAEGARNMKIRLEFFESSVAPNQAHRAIAQRDANPGSAQKIAAHGTESLHPNIPP